jgi:DmsE family decaheme c-type cytochrome
MKKNHALITLLLILSLFIFRGAIGETAATTGESATAGATGDTPAAGDTSATSNTMAPDSTATDSMATSATAASDVKPEYSKKGADTCLKCHDKDSEYPVFDIFQTKHAMQADSRTPFAGLQCEACHGPGVRGASFMEEAKKAGAHVGKVRPGQKRPPILNFGPKSDEPVATQNGMCLKCHENNERTAWHGSKHEKADVACASCHTIHTPHDSVLDKKTQPEKCYDCHQKERADFFKTSNHPVRFGQLGCSDCHAVHGSSTPALLGRPTLNQTCYTCHADKRGPFIWEHAPASEDCTLCHTPHGSIHPALLKKRAPLLCQQCHSQAGHPSVSVTSNGLPGGNPSALLLSGSCTNCHSQVHGSNHPSGVKLMR